MVDNNNAIVLAKSEIMLPKSKTSSLQILFDNLSIPFITFIYQIISKFSSQNIESLKNLKIGIGVLFIYYITLITYLLQNNYSYKLLNIYDRYYKRAKNIIFNVKPIIQSSKPQQNFIQTILSKFR
ncbi:hypothetical protein ABK040_010204 [Willaertia magna]